MGVCNSLCKEKSNQIIDLPTPRISTKELNFNTDPSRATLRRYLENNQSQMSQKLRNIFSVIIHSNLTEVIIDKDRITQRQAKFLSVGLKYCSSLKILHLINNDLGDSGVHLIASVFPYTVNLTTLIIEDNHIKSEGISDICSTLHYLTSLEQLSLSQNIMGEAVNAFANCLSYLSMLKELYLQLMEISSNDFNIISLQLCSCNLLEKLALGYNRLEIGSLKALYLIIRSLKNLEVLALSGISLPDSDLDHLLMNNTHLRITL